VSFSGGATNRRIHQPADGSAVGIYLVSAFKKKLHELDIPVYLNTKATDFIVDSQGRVTGVKAESSSKNYTLNGKAVVLATGGFGANEKMYTKYQPQLKGFVTTNSPGATGDGIVMAEKIGAALVDITQIQIHPTVEQKTSILITESVRGDGAILVNKEGRRFTNEMGTRDVVSAAVIAQSGGFAYTIFDQNLREGLKAIEGYIDNNIVTEGATVAELAGKLGLDQAALTGTLSTWNAAVAAKKDGAFNRTTGMEKDLSKAPYYAIKIAPGVHHTMGGVKIDTQARVISTSGNPIPSLFAAGEVTGGIHGNNRIGGNAVADIVIFGRIAGASAAQAVIWGVTDE
jgi:fumarate reductase flavoprotein subunit